MIAICHESSPKFSILIMTYSGCTRTENKQQICLKLPIIKPQNTKYCLSWQEHCSLLEINTHWTKIVAGVFKGYSGRQKQKLSQDKDKWSVQLWRKSFNFLPVKVGNGLTPGPHFQTSKLKSSSNKKKISHVLFYICLSKL